jgi:hypothetical protein
VGNEISVSECRKMTRQRGQRSWSPDLFIDYFEDRLKYKGRRKSLEHAWDFIYVK